MSEMPDSFEQERALIHRLNSASVPEMIDLLKRPSPADERTLRAHLGDATYDRMHALALQRTTAKRGLAKLGNVMVIHGIMGAELTSTRTDSGKKTKVWVSIFQMLLSRFMWFKLQPDGIHETDGRQSLSASGIIQKYYGELTMRLSETWNTAQFYFDWRKDIYRAAVELQERAADAFGRGAPFHIVAHSMGGLVARTFIKQNSKAWKAMQENGAQKGGRLIMLGTPNYGSFAVTQIMTGLEGIIRKLDFIDTRNNLREYIEVANTFPGSYQMMPSVTAMPEMEPLYQAKTWQPIEIPQTLLDSGRAFHKDIDPVKDDWMTYIAGYGQNTLNGVRDWARIHEEGGYTSTSWDGDGRVPHKLGLLGAGRVFYVKEAHADLPTNEAVQLAAGQLLVLGRNDNPNVPGISATLPVRRAIEPDAEKAAVAREARLEAELEELRLLANRARGTRAIPEATDLPSDESRRAEELIMAGWLGSGPTDGTRGGTTTVIAERAAALPEEDPAAIEIAVYRGNIDAVHTLTSAPPDAIAVGLYIGVRPDGAAWALDQSVTASLGGTDQGFLTQMLERGVIQAGLGQPFILPDSRTGGAASTRVLALAGMGIPGRFGAPEATVMARELCWTLGRIGKRHLATVLIGSGVGNLTIAAALEAWLRGVARAQGGMGSARLGRITFVERDRDRAAEIDRALLALKDRLAKLIDITYLGVTQSTDSTITQRERKQRENQVPARVTFTRDDVAGVYRFGSITKSAALPERTIPLDRTLVDEANRLLALKETPVDQMTWGRFLERLLIPAEFRTELQQADPLVMMLDSTTASIHWEMMANPGFDDLGKAFDQNAFLGTARGLTRQLRTTFAPPPEPPPPIRRRLRVLLVADPSADAPLPGAQVEGTRLAELFAAYNAAEQSRDNPIEVVTLFGPVQATRTQVMHQLMTKQFDVVHFAGHCFYDIEHPDRSGWVFGETEVLTAHEMNRIDRVPPFVFSNACESGVTPDRATKELPQSFAEAFFGRGVTNFVCTAWPVSDHAATTFALTVYRSLLGMTNTNQLEPETRPMWQAMQLARIALADPGADSPGDPLTWGAYQHYGNPYYRLITREPEDKTPVRRTRAAAKATARKAPSKKTARKATKTRKKG
jgi:hypothetical protein